MDFTEGRSKEAASFDAQCNIPFRNSLQKCEKLSAICHLK